jgi:hypothetical protein
MIGHRAKGYATNVQELVREHGKSSERSYENLGMVVGRRTIEWTRKTEF